MIAASTAAPLATDIEESAARTSHPPVISLETVPDFIVQDPELEAAKALHFQAHEKAKLLLESKSVFIPEPLPYKPEDIPVQVTDSPEVAAAKAEHFTVHERFIKFLKAKEQVVPDLPGSTVTPVEFVTS